MSANGEDEPLPSLPAAPVEPHDLARTVREARLLGQDIFEIAARLRITVKEVSALLMSHYGRIESEPTEQKSFYRLICLRQLDRLIATYFPMALLKEIVIEKMRAGESVTETDCYYPLTCAQLVIATIKLQSDLLGLRLQEPAKRRIQSPQEMFAWLRTQLPYIEEIVREAPRDVPSELPVKSIDHGPEEHSEAPPMVSELEKPAADDEDLDDLGEISFVQSKVAAPPPDPQVQVESDRAERRRRFFAGQPDGL